MKKMILATVALALILVLGCSEASADGWVDPLVVERQVYAYLTEELKLNSAAACGVLANMEYESNFQPTVLGDNDTSYGLCQWHEGRFTALKTYCTALGEDYRTVSGQMAYLSYELKSTYSGLFSALRSVENSADGAYRAAFLWCIQFERPEDMEEKAELRGNSAKYKYWNRYNSVTMITVEESVPDPEELKQELAQAPLAVEVPHQVEYVEQATSGRKCVAEKPEKQYYVNRNAPRTLAHSTPANGFAVGMLFAVSWDGVERKYRLPLPQEEETNPV